MFDNLRRSRSLLTAIYLSLPRVNETTRLTDAESEEHAARDRHDVSERKTDLKTTTCTINDNGLDLLHAYTHPDNNLIYFNVGTHACVFHRVATRMVEDVSLNVNH